MGALLVDTTFQIVYTNDMNLSTPAGQPTLLPDQVADALIGVIFRGELNPGDRIPEEKFAVRLKVSRVPLREAFKQLELLGIVRREPNRGNFVAGASWDEIADIMSVRNVLEGMAVERASLKGLPEDFAKMQTKVDEMKRFCSAHGTCKPASGCSESGPGRDVAAQPVAVTLLLGRIYVSG